MAGANHHHHHRNHHRKSGWDSNSSAPKHTPSSNPKPSPNPNGTNFNNKKPTPTTHQPDPFPYPDLSQLGPPPQPTYGFHMLLRRTILLADGTVRSYFALPPEYEELAGPLDGRGRERESQDYWSSLGLDNVHVGRGGGDGLGLKRKFGDEERVDMRNANDREYFRQRQQLMQYGNANSTRNSDHLGGASDRNGVSRRDSEEPRSSKYLKVGSEGDYGSSSRSKQALGSGSKDGGLNHGRIDSDRLKKEFLRFLKVINETEAQRKKYLEDGKRGSLRCVACGRSSKEFSDTHDLIMHTYHSDNADLLPDHLGLHKALCVLMGWNYSEPPDDSKSYQNLSPAEAAANKDDLILWPPFVFIHNTGTRKNEEGRMEGLGNKVMDARLRELGFTSGKAKSLYGKEGHQGITLVKFTGDRLGLKEAIRLSEYLEKENHGRKGWTHVEATNKGKNEEENPSLINMDESSNEKKRILYGYLATAADLGKVDFDTRKKAVIQSIRETLK